MPKLIAVGFALVWPLLLPLPAHAHHSTAAFDTDKQISVEGVLVRYEWINPHVFLWVEGEDAAGQTVTWEVEGSPPAFLARQGLSKDVLTIGARVTVHGSPGRDPKRGLVLMNTLDVGDESLGLGQQGAILTISQESPPEQARATSLAGNWATSLNMSAAMAFFDPDELALTDKGKAAAAAYEEGKTLGCTPMSSPGVMMAPDIKSIELRDDAVVLRRGWDSAERTIHLNVATHDGAAVSQLGHSIGHFEKNTLVIDTARFAPDAQGNAARVPSGSRKHTVERLALSEDGTHLVYSVMLEDSEYLAAPIVAEGVEWTYRPDLKYESLGCDPENALRGFE